MLDKLVTDEGGERMSSATKRVLAISLKELLTQRPLDKITVQELVDSAEVSRKTFYYHFQDIYALLEWILVDEGKKLLEGNFTAGTWQQGLRRVFSYFEENRAMILNVYRSLQRDEGLLEAHVTRLVRPMLEHMFDEQPDHQQVSAGDRQFILDLYSYGLVELFLRWISTGMKPSGGQLMDQIEKIFTGSMAGLIRRCI